MELIEDCALLKANSAKRRQTRYIRLLIRMYNAFVFNDNAGSDIVTNIRFV